MRRKMMFIVGCLLGTLIMAFFILNGIGCSRSEKETKAQLDARMEWWREARFGMFIHWGLYAIPAGEWNGRTDHAEWIRTTAQIPIDAYDRFVGQFNPVKFDADAWVRMAKDAGMKYIVITSKHHDGFCLFDSKQTDFDVMSTPFKRDILKELADACRTHGLKMCWYHSIMDWHHPDYLPRRNWEKDRSTEGADFDRYVRHMKKQLRELVKNYGEIGVLWFDGEWEETWNHAYGKDLYDYVRKLQPSIIINNRVDKGRAGMQGLTKGGEFVGDFGTPEQEIPPTGLPGVDWETCMTMNDHWGYNKNDDQWKSSEDLIRKLADIASKGGNFLLNVGPTAEGVFPPESVERLRDLGKWMRVNGEAIYRTEASPFDVLPWGRCTRKTLSDGNTRLYLHVFDWPEDGLLWVKGLTNQAVQAYALADVNKNLFDVSRREDALVIRLPKNAPDPMNSVVVLDIIGRPDVTHPPAIEAEQDIFIDALDVTVSSDRENVEVRVATDGSDPTMDSPLALSSIRLTESALVSARAFRDGKPVSEVNRSLFVKVKPRPSEKEDGLKRGLRYAYYEGVWDRLPDFDCIEAKKTGIVEDFNFSPRDTVEYFGFRYEGYISIPRDGVYTFYTVSDDGSRLYLGEKLVVDNDGLHGELEVKGVIALAAGFHPIRVTFFEKTGGDMLEVSYMGPGMERQVIPPAVLFHEE